LAVVNRIFDGNISQPVPLLTIKGVSDDYSELAKNYVADPFDSFTE